MKKAFWVLVILLILLIIPSQRALAAGSSAKLPTRLNYLWESINYSVLTWRNTSKVALLDRYANRRVEIIKVVAKDNDLDLTKKFINEYLNFKTKQSNLIKNKNLSLAIVQEVAEKTLAQQKDLSILRQESSEDIKKEIAHVQETVINNQQELIKQKDGQPAAENFADQTVAIWRDPQNLTKDDEKATRIYAAGTTAGGRDGVVIDGGEGKIVQNSTGELKIEYAPGTGPNSVVNTQGKGVWTIQQGDGTVVTSYQAAGTVVIGSAGGTAGNVVVVSSGQTVSGSGQQVTGGGGEANTGGTGQTNVIQGQSGSDATGDNSSGNTVQTQP